MIPRRASKSSRSHTVKAAFALGLIAVMIASTVTVLPAQITTDGLYSLIRDDNREFDLQDARKKLRAGDNLAAIELLRDVLRASPSAVFEEHPGHWIGLREAARTVLERLEGEARTVYERIADTEAAPRLAGLLERRDAEEVSRVALRYPASRSALDARLLAGDIFLEGGRTLRALREYDLVARTRITPEISVRRFLGRTVEGLPTSSKDLPGGELELGGRSLSRDAFVTTVTESLRHLEERPWAAYGGGLSGLRRPTDPIDLRDAGWTTAIEHLDIERYPQNLFATCDGRRVFVNTGTRLYGIDLLRGAQGDSWESMDYIREVRSRSEQQNFLTSLSSDFAHSSSFAHGIVVAPLQVPIIPEVAKENHNFQQIPIMRRLPVRRLHAFETATGRLLWTHYEEDRVRADLSGLPLDVSGPPLVVDDTVYVLTHSQIGTIALYLSAFDLRTGRLSWKTLVCSSQTEVNMFGNRSNEFASAPLCYENGCVFGATNLGLCFSARVDDGSLRWLRSYPIISIPQSRMRPLLRELAWANNPPVAVDGRVIMTPTDSPSALCLDAEDGRILWELAHDYPDRTTRSFPYDLRWFLGVVDGQAWFAGQALVRVAIEGGSARLVASPEALGMATPDDARSIPRPLLTENFVYFSSVSGGLVVLDLDGKISDAPRLKAPHIELGNLLSQGGILVTTGPQSVSAYYDIDALLARARQAMETASDDLAPALFYAELLASRPHPSITQLEAAVTRFRDLIAKSSDGAAGGSLPIALRAKAGLYRKLRQLARVARDLGRTEEAKRHRNEAMSIARELWRANALDESDLIRLSIEVYDDAATEPEVRESILDRLEREHGTSVYAFGGAARSRVGLFVLMRRYANLEAADTDGTGRLALLRRILVEYGDARLPGSSDEDETGRNFAIRQITTLEERFGEKIYAPYEKEARTLLASADKDKGKLQVVLEQYPTSSAARDALVRLAVLAGEQGDLIAALDAYRIGRSRMTNVPVDLLRALATAARERGNRVLAAAFEASANSTIPTVTASEIVDDLRGDLDTLLQHTPNLGTGEWGRSLVVSRVEGFEPSAARDIPLLLWADRTLAAFAPTIGERRTGSEQPRIENESPIWTLEYDHPMRDLEGAIYGDVLVLPEETRVRGISLTRGTVLWSRSASDVGTRNQNGFVTGRSLESGVFGLVAGSIDFSREGFTLVGIEPLTGGIVFSIALENRQPMMILGQTLRFARERNETWRMQLMNPLTSIDETLVFDGRDAPRIHQPPRGRHVRVVGDSLYVLVSFEAAMLESDSGLYCWQRTKDGLRRRWFLPSSDAANYDTFVIRGPEILLTTAFQTQMPGRLLRIDATTGKLLHRIECGRAADLAGSSYGTDARTAAGPTLVLGEDDQSRARLSYIDTREGMDSWGVDLPTRVLALPLAADFPAPAFGPREVVITVPESTGGRQGRIGRLLRFANRDATLLDPPIRSIDWLEPVEVDVWNGMLLVRTRNNAWLFGAKIESADSKDVGNSGKATPPKKR
ncbi:MAG: PQQ-binding-like beta-propeller repeat protein [Planctomycetes bacterium]|nr:PQQ-binding-like beta-propeller repeat protein [Planctomycetota bacterium]